MNKIIKYGLVLIKDKKFLINRKKGTTLFLMPGGKPKPGESVEACLIREIKKEHGCTLRKEYLRFFGEFEDIAANELHTIISMKVYLGQIKGKLKIDSEIEEMKWFGKDDNPSILSPIIKNKILPALLKHKLI